MTLHPYAITGELHARPTTLIVCAQTPHEAAGLAMPGFVAVTRPRIDHQHGCTHTGSVTGQAAA